MPTAIAYRRAPLVDLAYVPLSDTAVHADGLQQLLTDRALKLIDVSHMSALDSVLATKLGGYTETPPVPDVEAAAEHMTDAPAHFVETARAAAENGCTHFTTTLLVSPYQNYELICKTGEEAAAKYGVQFLRRDFRPRFREGQAAAREAGMYMQK